MTPQQKLPERPEQTASDRVKECRSFLLTHGFLSQKEAASVNRRIWLWMRRKSNTEKF